MKSEGSTDGKNEQVDELVCVCRCHIKLLENTCKELYLYWLDSSYSQSYTVN